MKKIIIGLFSILPAAQLAAQSWQPAAPNIYFTGGNVAIGTTNTTLARLTVVAGGQNDGIWLGGTGATSAALLNNMTPGAWNALAQAGDNLLLWKGSAPNSVDGGGLVIGPWSTASSGGGMRITPAGNIGISTANPRTRLDLWGGDLVVTGTDFSGTAYVTSRGGTAWYSNNYYSNGIAILPSGNVLIGQATQVNSSYKLDVAGNVGATKIVVNTNGADYVFDPAYHVSPLREVEAYIKQHRHLPGIAPAGEMQADGLDIGDHEARLLQKIEELTLYAIDQKKQIDALKEKVRTMENLQTQINELKALLKK